MLNILKSNTKKLIPFIILLLLLSSCASVFNNSVQKVFIATDNKVKIISVEKSLPADSLLLGTNTSQSYYMPRSKKSLKITVEVDSSKKEILLKPVNSFAYWFNIYCNYGIGMLIDKDNIKRYGYPVQNYISVKDNSIYVSRFPPIHKGTINYSLSLPFTTIFNIKTINGRYQSGGIFGIEAGIDYFYKKNSYVSLNIGAATDKFPVEHFGKRYVKIVKTRFTSIRNNHVIGSFDVGYGINLSQLKWEQRTIGDTTNLDQTQKNIGLGFSLSTQYRIGKYFRLGLLYQPHFLNTSFAPLFTYQHYISFNLIWKFPLNNND